MTSCGFGKNQSTNPNSVVGFRHISLTNAKSVSRQTKQRQEQEQEQQHTNTKTLTRRSRIQTKKFLKDYQLSPSTMNNSLPVQLSRMVHHHRESADKRMKFAIFLKVLLRYLKQRAMDDKLRQVRLVIRHCTQRNRNGDPNFYPLVTAIELRLQQLLDDKLWYQAQAYTKLYHLRRSHRQLQYRSRLAVLEPSPRDPHLLNKLNKKK